MAPRVEEDDSDDDVPLAGRGKKEVSTPAKKETPTAAKKETSTPKGKVQFYTTLVFHINAEAFFFRDRFKNITRDWDRPPRCPRQTPLNPKP